MIKLYADINCPFCFAQHERLYDAGLVDDVEWCYVEHAPELDSAANSVDQLDLLAEEYRLLSLRSHDLHTQKPDFCVNSRLAVLSLMTVAESHPDLVKAYRRALYYAYWREGKDISDPKVLADIQHEVGLEQVEVSSEAEEKQERYQRQWAYGGLDGRIPAMQDHSGRVLLGLQHVINIKNFVDGADENEQGDLACAEHEKPVVGLYQVPLLHDVFEKSNHRFRLLFYSSPDELRASYDFLPPDVLVVSATQYTIEHVINELRSDAKVSNMLPILVVSDELTPELESHAFNAGVADVVAAESVHQGFFARIDAHVKKNQVLLNLKEHASIDPLTGLLNKRMLERRFNEEWRSATRHQLPLCLIVIDIDFFKLYNDEYGHGAGDLCLKQVSKALQVGVERARDLVARFGGEEFVVLLPETKLEGALKVVANIQKAVASYKIKHEKSLPSKMLTLSFGVGCAVPHADRTPDDFFEYCDGLLYQAKSNGRNQFKAEVMAQPNYSKP